MTLLIIGIDPGTTLGYAILDDTGNLVLLGSNKGLSVGELIRKIVVQGRPLIVSTDKFPAPGFVQNIAVKLGAKLSYPKQDLLVQEKRSMVASFGETRSLPQGMNAHETDALAAALFALENNRSFLQKADRFLEKHNAIELTEEFKLLMMRNEQLPFEAAFELLQKPATQIQTGRVHHKRQKIMTGEDIKQNKTLRLLEAELVLQEEKNQKLSNLVKEKDKLIAKFRRKAKGVRKEELISFKEKKIHQYANELEQKNQLISKLKADLHNRDEFISQIKGNILVKKLESLSFQEFQSKLFLHISEDDVLLVKDCAIRSEKAIEQMKGKVKVIIAENPPAKKDKEFIYLGKAGLIISESENFALADSKKLEEEIRKKTILSNVISQYQKERQNDV